MTVEARILFVVLFFGAWAFLGLMAWACVAVLRRGEGGLLALPVSLTGACTFGVSVPLIGLTDATGFFVSVPAAVAGSLMGYAGVLALMRRFVPRPDATHQGVVQVPPRE